MKILIAVWGDPERWDEVNYEYQGQTEKAKSTINLIKQVENPDKIVIICVDTLADNYVISYKNLFSNPYYSHIKDMAESAIKNFCLKEFSFQPDKIIVSYGVGEFNNIKFIGNTQDFYYEVLKELSFFFGDIIKNSKEKIEVILDITHGINYMPTLTYRALREVLQILAYTYDVKLKVLNADPYIRQVKPEKLNINVIEETKIKPYLLAYRIDSNPDNVKPINSKENRIIEEIKKFLKENSYCNGNNGLNIKIHIFLSAFIHAMPVFIISYLISSQTIKDLIDKISQMFEKHIKIINNQKINIKREIEYTIEFENLIKAYLISLILENFGFSQKNDIPLRDIKKIGSLIFRKLSIEKNTIKEELRKIEKIKYKIQTNYNTYISLLSSKKVSSNEIEINRRNFFAHVGFEHNVIELRINNNDIELTINQQLKQKVESLLKNALKLQ